MTIAEQGTTGLEQMVAQHYDNILLMHLEGEIHRDNKLSEAEVQAALSAYNEFSGTRDVPNGIYLPCAGTLRHTAPLLRAGAKHVTAVDLSAESMCMGLEWFGGQIGNRITTVNANIADTDCFAPADGFQLGVMLGNSYGDVDDPDANQEFTAALGSALRPGGMLVFDYVGDRYNPPAGESEVSRWNDVLALPDEKPVPVFDTRSRAYEPIEKGVGRLRFTCEVSARDDGQIIVLEHPYQKLVLSDDRLTEVFGEAGMNLFALGPMSDWSPYHAARIDGANDLGMMGTPNHLYVAVK